MVAPRPRYPPACCGWAYILLHCPLCRAPLCLISHQPDAALPIPLPAGKKRSLADYAIVRRIHFIFERAVRKFKSDVSLWTAWLEFCRASNSSRRLGRVVGRALQIHPTEPGLWVYAAAWEFEHNANPAAARALMQQGLRMCKYSEKMWLDYFDMVSAGFGVWGGWGWGLSKAAPFRGLLWRDGFRV